MEIKINPNDNTWRKTTVPVEAVYVGGRRKKDDTLDTIKATVSMVSAEKGSVMLAFKDVGAILICPLDEIRVRVTDYLMETMVSLGWEASKAEILRGLVVESFEDSGKRNDYMTVPCASYMEHLLHSLSYEIGYESIDAQGQGLEAACGADRTLLAMAAFDIGVHRMQGGDNSMLS